MEGICGRGIRSILDDGQEFRDGADDLRISGDLTEKLQVVPQESSRCGLESLEITSSLAGLIHDDPLGTTALGR